MTATAAPTVKNQEFTPVALVESAIGNSITDFNAEKLVENKVNIDNEKEDFINSFICHLIFYTILCVSLFLHILIDLGLGSFLRNNLVRLIGLESKTVFDKRPAFA